MTNSKFQEKTPSKSITYVGYRITERCNKHCPFCFSREKTFAPDQTLPEIEKFLKNLKKAQISTIGVMGGEPLVRNDIVAVLRLIKSYNFEVILSTNAILLKPDLLDEIHPLIDYLSISLDADTQIANDRYRGLGQFSAATKMIAAYNPLLYHFKLKVNTVVHKRNIDHDIDNIPKFFQNKPIVWKLLQYTPRLDGRDVKDKFQISTREFKLKGNQLQIKYPHIIMALRTYTLNEKYDLLLLRPNGDLQINHHETYRVVGNANCDDIGQVIKSVWNQQTSYFNENWDEFKESYRRL